MKIKLLLSILLSWATLAVSYAQPLSGDYTINSGASTGGTNFQSFGDLAAALNANGVSGHVIATVEPGSGPYQEQVVFNNIAGTGPNATITLDGSGETISALTSSANRHVVRLANCQYFTVENLHVDWDPASTGGFYAIHVFSSGQHITIQNCSVDLTGTNSTLYGAYVVSGSETSILDGGTFSNISILNNHAEGGGYGASAIGLTAALATGIEIAHNQLISAHSNAVYVKETDGVNIHHNFIDKTTSNVTSWNAIQLAQNTNVNGQVHNNYIQVSQTTNGTQTFRGIYLFNGTGHKVYNNIITGIQLESGNVTAIEVRTAATAPEIYFNTISIDKSTGTTGNLAGIAESLSNTNSKLRNNVISISQPSTGFRAGLWLASNSVLGSAFDSDYNVIYVPGGNTAQKGSPITGITPYPSLADWQNASGQDANSYDLDPELESPTLPKPTNLDLDDKGLAIQGYTLDYFGVVREATPDIGAIEFGGCPPPGAPAFIFGETEHCVNTAGAVYFITPVIGATDYIWNLPPGAVITSGEGTPSITVTFGTASGAISVAAQDSCGASAPAILSVSILDEPQITGDIIGPTGICYNSGLITFTIPAVTGSATYEWTLPAGAEIIAGQGTNTLIADFGTSSGMISVTAENACGVSDPVSMFVEVYPPTTVTLDIPADTLCLNSGLYTLSGGIPVDATFSGPGVGAGVFDPAEAGIGAHTITLTYTDEFGCIFTASDQIVVDACAGIFDPGAPVEKLDIFPNPTTGLVHLGNLEAGDWEIRVYDRIGRLAFSRQNVQTIDLGDQPAGMFFVVARSGLRSYAAVIVKE